MHGVVGVDLLQSHQEALYQVLSVLELDELEGHLAADADNDRVGQQACVLHLLNTYYLEQRWHTKTSRKEPGRCLITPLCNVPRQEHFKKSSEQRWQSGLGTIPIITTRGQQFKILSTGQAAK